MDICEKLQEAIAPEFNLNGKLISLKPFGDGLINDTYYVETEPGYTDYIIQRKNHNIFKDVPSMMSNIARVTGHLNKKISGTGGDPARETINLVKTRDGKEYHRDSEGNYWTVMEFIPGTISYNKADDPSLAEKGGQAIGKFQFLLSDFGEPLADILPGFHNIRFRLDQWDKTIQSDRAGRCCAHAAEIGWIESRREKMLDFWKQVEDGMIPLRVTHNDTKISNVLFEQDGNALCVIDLDTVLTGPSFNDFGDAIRSYANTGMEDDPDPANVSLDMDIYTAYTRGYLENAVNFLTDSEIESLAFSALYITYEQTLRFLMDYLDGDTYYKIQYPDHNLVRTRAQYALLESMEANYPAMDSIVKQTVNALKMRDRD